MQVLESTLLGLVGGVVSSAIFLMILTFVRPRIEISGVIARRKTPGSQADAFSLKIRNLSRSQLLDVRIKAAFTAHYDPERPRVGRGIQLQFEYPTLFDLAKREPAHSTNGRSTFEFCFATPLDPLVTLSDDWAIRIAVSAQHSVTGLGSITKRNLVGRSVIRDGVFVQGAGLTVHDPLATPDRVLDTWEPLRSGDQIFNDAAELLSAVWALGTTLSNEDRSRRLLRKKGSEFDVVSSQDLSAEGRIVGILQRLFPEDGILGEEIAWIEGTSGAQWIVDPIDGSVNYAYGDASWGIALALERGGAVQASILAFPELSLSYIAVRGEGAYCNGERLTVSDAASLESSLVATRFGTTKGDRTLELALVQKLLPQVRDIRRSGCTSLDIARVASGLYDGYAGRGLGYWDAAAGALLVEEAGGRWSDWNGMNRLDHGTLIAGNATIYAELAKLTESIR